MLQPTNRLTLIDAMRPPAGFELESAMAVTFTLDLRALLAAPAAFAMTGVNAPASSDAGVEPIDLLHAVRSYSDKITVFSQAGEIALAPARRIFAFLERSVVPVLAPFGGVVHPKVWVLRFSPLASQAPTGRESVSRMRVLVASRNLTFDSSWDTVIRLDETTAGAGAGLARVADLFEGLAGQAASTFVEPHTARVQSLSDDLRSARFAMPRGVDALSVHLFGLERGPSPLPPDAERSLIVSPFVTDDFFKSVHPAPIDELVSRPEALDALAKATRDQIETLYAFDDGSATEFGPAERNLSLQDPGRPLRGLHAKVFAFESEDRARLFLGSANATGAAFTANIEILIEFAGPIEAIGIDRLCQGTDEEPGLRDLFITYVGPTQSDDDSDGESLDEIRRKIASLAVVGTVEPSGSDWVVTYRTTESIEALPGIGLCCWPLASPGNRRKVATGVPLEARFETALESVSGFLAIEIAADDGKITQFVVPVPLTGLPEQRDRVLMRALVGNAERFFRYLLALLDEEPTESELLGAVEGLDADGNGRDLSTLPVLEKLVRTMRRNPAKLAGLHPLVSDLEADGALPEGFVELWEMIYDVGVAGVGL